MIKVYVIDMGREFYYLQWDDPVTGKRVTRSSKKKTRRDAERAASAKEKDLADGEFSPGRHRWGDFLSRYQMEHLRSLASRSECKAVGILESYERLMRPQALSSVTAATVSTYAAKLRDASLTEATIAAHLRTIRAALSWAKEKGFIGFVPTMPRIRRASGRRAAKGRPITLAEFARMIRASRDIVGSEWRPWVRLMRGLWLSGLRLGEGMQLRWTPGRHPSIDLTAPGWLVIPEESDKGFTDERIPLTPDFAAWLKRLPRDGELVLSPGVDENRASKVVSMIGEMAGVITDPAKGRTATAHDFRRSFGTRWAPRLMPVDLQRLMRHASIETTLNYYLDQDAEGLATRLVNSGVNFPHK